MFRSLHIANKIPHSPHSYPPCKLPAPTDQNWKGVEDANGGYITVKRDGEVVCYYLYQRDEFEKYLFNKTHFDTPSTSRRDAFCVYKDDNSYKIKLNLDIRFNR